MGKLKNNFIKIGFLILLSLTPIIWFWGRKGIIINGVDTNFPLNPLLWFVRRFSVWSDTLNGGMDFSSSTSGMFFHLIQAIPFKLGFSLTNVELISLIFWFALIVVGSYLLARYFFPGNSFAQLVLVVIYTFNIYMFNAWENVKVSNLSLVAAIPFVILIFDMVAHKKLRLSKAFVLSLLIGIVISGGGINPAYITSFFMLFFIYFVGLILFSKETKRDIFFGFVVIALGIVVINLFWILPSLNYILKNISSNQSIGSLGFANWVDSLSRNSSVVNIVRLFGAWDWYIYESKIPVYIPYSIKYFFNPLFIIFSFVVTFLFLISFLIKNSERKYLYPTISVMALVGIFMGLGSHDPTGGIFKWLGRHIPFFSLFRSPWYIFTPLLIFSYAIGVGLLVDSLLHYARLKKAALLLKIATLLFIVVYLFYSYPQVTGKIFRPGRKDGFYINFPDYVLAAGKWLEGKKGGRVISYPDEVILNFNWGYRGIESILQLVSDREMIFPSINAGGNISLVSDEFYSKLKKGETGSVFSLMSKLGADTIFEMNDLSNMAPMGLIKAAKINTFGKWNFYSLPVEGGTNKIFTLNNFIFFSNKEEGSKALSVLSNNQHIVGSNDSVAHNIPQIGNNAGNVILALNSHLKKSFDFEEDKSSFFNGQNGLNVSVVNFDFIVKKEGNYQPILERYKVEEFGIDPSKELSLTLNGNKTSWKPVEVNDSFVKYEKVHFFIGEYIVQVKLDNANMVVAGSNFIEEGQGTFERGSDGSLAIINRKLERDIFANYQLGNFDPMQRYYVKFDYLHSYGGGGLVLVSQTDGIKYIKSQVDRIPSYSDWSPVSVFYNPVDVKSKLEVNLISTKGSDSEGTKVNFRNLQVFKLFTNDMFFLEESKPSIDTPSVKFSKVSPVEYRGEVKNIKGNFVLFFNENYSPDWELKLIGHESYYPLHFTVDLYANAWEVDGLGGDQKFEIYYRPQNLRNIGMAIAFVSVLGGLSVYLYVRKKNNL